MRDFSISRSIERSDGGGVRVPGDATQTLYVWFDALTNYLDGAGYGQNSDQFDRFWSQADRIIHAIVKAVLKFHALYWPGMLSAAGLRLPTDLHLHGFLTVDGQKISKSLGNAVDLIPLIERFGSDALRYYLLRYVPTGLDSDFPHTRLVEVYRNDLADSLGNLVSRFEALAARADQNRVRQADAQIVAEGLEKRRFHITIDQLRETVRELNRDIEEKRPREYLENGKTERSTRIITRWIQELVAVSGKISPFLPDTATVIQSRFCHGDSLPSKITQSAPLFPKET